MKYTTWLEARNNNPELEVILTRRECLASLDRELSSKEDNELRELQKSFECWGLQLNLD